MTARERPEDNSFFIFLLPKQPLMNKLHLHATLPPHDCTMPHVIYHKGSVTLSPIGLHNIINHNQGLIYKKIC